MHASCVPILYQRYTEDNRKTPQGGRTVQEISKGDVHLRMVPHNLSAHLRVGSACTIHAEDGEKKEVEEGKAGARGRHVEGTERERERERVRKRERETDHV